LNKTLFIVAILISNFDFAQNLVPNPSFEVFDTCPTAFSTSGNYQIDYALGWYSPTFATSDYYNSCNIGSVGVPSNGLGYQLAFDGNGYVGILLLVETGEPSWFEYIQAKLNSSLTQGLSYRLSFNVNLSNGSDYAIQKIGAWFTKTSVNSNDSKPLFNVMPQIVSNNGFITDTVGWTTIEGNFIADGDEEYITIGFYSDTTSMDTITSVPGATPSLINSYYYIDGLELEEVEQAIVIPNIITPNGDGTNDIFQLNFPYERMVIYNRWGQQLFESNSNEFDWNGRTTNGNELVEGTYYYLITTKEETFKGFVQVIR
tara:strand:+ start:419 stop:1366 length:948 start_codon:yes stop_codon:yes gene_type:complete